MLTDDQKYTEAFLRLMGDSEDLLLVMLQKVGLSAKFLLLFIKALLLLRV